MPAQATFPASATFTTLYGSRVHEPSNLTSSRHTSSGLGGPRLLMSSSPPLSQRYHRRLSCTTLISTTSAKRCVAISSPSKCPRQTVKHHAISAAIILRSHAPFDCPEQLVVLSLDPSSHPLASLPRLAVFLCKTRRHVEEIPRRM